MRASHIVGGELYYDCLGNDDYRVTLKLYRDCYCTNCAAYGDPEYLTIFDGSGNLVSQEPMNFPGSTQLNPPITNPCLVPPSICVERAIYSTTIHLPANTFRFNNIFFTIKIHRVGDGGSV